MLRQQTEFGLSDPGKMRDRVEVQALARGANSYGASAGTWATETTVRAAIDPVGGREYLRGEQTPEEVTHIVWLRYLAGLTSKKRLKWLPDGQILQIVRVNTPRGVKRWMELLCKEQVVT